MHAAVRRHPPGLGVDRRDRLTQQANARLGERGIRQAHLGGRRLAEHHVELRVAEDEGVGAVDQRDARLVAERRRQERRQLETAEPRSQDQYARLHPRSLTGPF